MKPILPHILNGQNASVFAYGPTGAGMSAIFSFELFVVYVIFSLVPINLFSIHQSKYFTY